MPFRVSFCATTLLFLGFLAGISAAAEKAPEPQKTTLTPSLVTVHANKKPLAEVLKTISEATGNPIDYRAAGSAAVSIDLQNVPFWRALDALAAASNTQVDLYQRSRMLRLSERLGSSAAPVSYDGLFRCAVRKVTVVRDLDFGTSSCTVQVEVAWEPRLEPLLVETRPRDIVLQDDHGQTIAVPADGGGQAFVDGKLALALDVPLPALPRSATKIGLFSGKLAAIAPTAMLTFSFAPLTTLAGAKLGSPARRHVQQGVTCTITRVDLFSDRTTVQVQLDLPSGGPSLESYQSWVVNDEMWLERKDGARRYPGNNYSIDSSSSHHAVLSYHFTQRDVLTRPGDWKVVYRAPAGLVEKQFSFLFKDVPLP